MAGKPKSPEVPEGELKPIKLKKVAVIDDIVYRPTADPEVDAYVDQATLEALREQGAVD